MPENSKIADELDLSEININSKIRETILLMKNSSATYEQIENAIVDIAFQQNLS